MSDHPAVNLKTDSWRRTDRIRIDGGTKTQRPPTRPPAASHTEMDTVLAMLAVRAGLGAGLEGTVPEPWPYGRPKAKTRLIAAGGMFYF